MKAYHLPAEKADLEHPDGNANYVGLIPKGLKCCSQVANTRESNHTVKQQDIHARHIAKCWNMYHQMLDFIKSIENDDSSFPEFMWKERNRIITRSKKAQ